MIIPMEDEFLNSFLGEYLLNAKTGPRFGHHSPIDNRGHDRGGKMSRDRTVTGNRWGGVNPSLGLRRVFDLFDALVFAAHPNDAMRR